MEARLGVYRIGRESPLLIGYLDRTTGSFAYDITYLERSDARPISISLPLRAKPYEEPASRPYFEGLVPEGAARRLMASELHVREDDYLSMLAHCGLDCIGDLIIAEELAASSMQSHYEAVDEDELASLFARHANMAELNGSDRLSLAGTQSKVGLAHDPYAPIDTGWFRAKGTAASSHILKACNSNNVAYLEYLCMNAAALCEVAAAETALLDFGVPVLCSRRFDRQIETAEDGGSLRVDRLHQEDLTQAFGLTSGSKYAELDGGTLSSVAHLLSAHADEPAIELRKLARLVCFNYLIGNCDNHLKNMSLVYGKDWMGCALAPAYDLVCTTWFPDLSRDMGMALGGVRDIDRVVADDLRECAQELGIGKRMFATIAHDLAERISDAISSAASEAAPAFEEVGWRADELIDDVEPRRQVLSRV